MSRLSYLPKDSLFRKQMIHLEGRGGGLAGQQSRELVKLPITLNPPLEAQRGENSENVTLSPQKGSSEGRDFRGWGSGF